MRISETGIWTELIPVRRPAHAQRQLGFTLIEIMVVVTLIGVMISMVLVSSKLIRDDRDVEDQAQKLAAIIEVIADEAQMQGRDFGMELMSAGYRFVEFDPFLEIWVEIKDDDLLQQRNLTEGMEFELSLESRIIPLKSTAAELKEKKDEDDDNRYGSEVNDYAPHILIMSSGDISPFRLDLIRLADDKRKGLLMDANGKLEVTDDDDE